MNFPNSPSSRLRAPIENIQTLDTDVLIIGGGVAGCLAAIGAAEKGAKSVICEKKRKPIELLSERTKKEIFNLHQL